jgi:hypothetical protein
MIDAIAPARVLSAWCLLFLCATVYDRLVVDRIERLKPSIGVTAWEVVGGVAFTLVVYGFIAGLDAMILLFVLFSGSGLPMILGSHNRHASLAG